jgi:hypothetical protein
VAECEGTSKPFNLICDAALKTPRKVTTFLITFSPLPPPLPSPPLLPDLPLIQLSLHALFTDRRCALHFAPFRSALNADYNGFHTRALRIPQGEEPRAEFPLRNRSRVSHRSYTHLARAGEREQARARAFVTRPTCRNSCTLLHRWCSPAGFIFGSA